MSAGSTRGKLPSRAMQRAASDSGQSRDRGSSDSDANADTIDSQEAGEINLTALFLYSAGSIWNRPPWTQCSFYFHTHSLCRTAVNYVCVVRHSRIMYHVGVPVCYCCPRSAPCSLRRQEWSTRQYVRCSVMCRLPIAIFSSRWNSIDAPKDVPTSSSILCFDFTQTAVYVGTTKHHIFVRTSSCRRLPLLYQAGDQQGLSQSVITIDGQVRTIFCGELRDYYNKWR